MLKKPNEYELQGLKQVDRTVIDFVERNLKHQDTCNRRIQGEIAAEGRGRAQILDEFLKLLKGADEMTVSPA